MRFSCSTAPGLFLKSIVFGTAQNPASGGAVGVSAQPLLKETPGHAQVASDAEADGQGSPSPGAPLSKQHSGGAGSSKPVRRRRAGQPPAPAELPNLPDLDPVTTRKRPKRRTGATAVHLADSHAAAPHAVPETYAVDTFQSK